tara:strand:+ start:1375 stop:2046 length:672 start_codon:yes stop_codon:yes gene_type:complete
MNSIIPFGYHIGHDKLDYNFRDLRKDNNVSLNASQRLRYPDDPMSIDLHTLSNEELTDKYLRILEKYPELKALIESRFNMFAYKMLAYDYKFKISTSWLTRLDPGDHIDNHRHHNCYYSGLLYYGKNYNNAAPLILENPISKTTDYNFPTREHNIMMHDFTLQLFTGALYFFPSGIRHFTTINQGETRQSLAFNIVPTVPIYSGDSSFNYEWVRPVSYDDTDD